MNKAPKKFGSEIREFLETTQKEDIRQYRISQCGQPKRQFDKYTGYLKIVRWYCKQIHDCPQCLERRVNEESQPLFDYVRNGGELYKTVFADENEASRFAKRIGGENYNRYPQENGDIVFLHPPEYSLENSRPFVLETETRDSLTRLLKTPAGKRISGSLTTKKEADQDDGEGDEIVNLEFGVYDIPDTPQEIADRAAIHVPPIRLPETISQDSLQEAIYSAEALFESIVYDLLGTKPTKIHSMTKRVEVSKIHWPPEKKITSIEQVSPANDSRVDNLWKYYGEPDWPKEPDLG